MTAKHFLSFCLFVSFALLQAQNEVEFKVQHRKVIVTPAMDTLLANRKYHFKIEGIAYDKIARLEFDSGSVSLNQTGITIITSNNSNAPVTCPLRIFENKDGGWKIAHAQNYVVQTAAYSKRLSEEIKFSLLVHGHSKHGNSDMSIQDGDTVHIAFLRDADLLQAVRPYAADPFCRVQDFDVKLMQRKGSAKKYNSDKANLPAAFLTDLEEAPEGAAIRFENINCFLGGIADMRTFAPFTIYLTR